MTYQFIRGNFNNFYLERGLRKSSLTIKLIFRAIETIIKTTEWNLFEDKPIWVSTPREELHFDDLEKAFKYLEKINKFALFVALQHEKNKFKAFVRWYDSEPQVDVLSVEGAFYIEEGKVTSYTPIHILEGIVNVVSKTLENKISAEETRALSQTFSEDMKSTWLANKFSNK